MFELHTFYCEGKQQLASKETLFFSPQTLGKHISSLLTRLEKLVINKLTDVTE